MIVAVMNLAVLVVIIASVVPVIAMVTVVVIELIVGAAEVVVPKLGRGAPAPCGFLVLSTADQAPACSRRSEGGT